MYTRKKCVTYMHSQLRRTAASNIPLKFKFILMGLKTQSIQRFWCGYLDPNVEFS